MFERLRMWRYRRFINSLPPVVRTNGDGTPDEGFIDRIFLRDNKRRFNPWSSFDREVVRDGIRLTMVRNIDKLFPALKR